VLLSAAATVRAAFVRGVDSDRVGVVVEAAKSLSRQHPRTRDLARARSKKGHIDTYISAFPSCCNAFLHAALNASSTLVASLADVSKYGMLPFCWHHVRARFCETMRFDSSMSILLPRTMKGKFSGSRGEACAAAYE
jgi:hypothetical protein